MKGLLKEFREFMDRGNVMDMAIGIIIGGAFTTFVQALITDIINPIITAATGGTGEATGWSIAIPGSSQSVDFGAFISAIINFVLIALIVFLLMRSYNKAKKLADDASKKLADAAAKKLGDEKSKKLGLISDETEDAEPVVRICPYCKQEIPEGATRCPHCTSVLPNATADEVKAMAMATAQD